MKKLIPVHVVPIACTLDAGGQKERLEEFRLLFADAFVGRERTVDGIRFRFRADDGIEARVRDLAERESQCCAFFAFTVTAIGGEVLWDARVPGDDDISSGALALFFDLPASLGVGVPDAPSQRTQKRRSPAAITGVVGALQCAGACALPFLGIAFLGGIAAVLCDPRVLLVGGVGVLGAGTLLRRRGAAKSACGC